MDRAEDGERWYDLVLDSIKLCREARDERNRLQQAAPIHDSTDEQYSPWGRCYNAHGNEFWGAPDKATSAMYGFEYGYAAGAIDAERENAALRAEVAALKRGVTDYNHIQDNIRALEEDHDLEWQK